MYWLDLAASQDARLRDVDSLLRDTWLECCGHLSEFYTGGRSKVGKGTAVSHALEADGDRLGYVYDFGSSTELLVTRSGVVEGPSGTTVDVVARNEAPAWPCEACGQPAVVVCARCVYEDRGLCCTEHSESHSCGDEAFLPVVNSPRMGVCGYTGEE